MNKTIIVEEMHCEHCEQSVKDALLKIEGIEEVRPDRQTNTVELVLKNDVAENEIKQAIEDEGFVYKGIKQ